MVTTCRSLVPVLLAMLRGLMRTSKMWGSWSQGMRKWVPSPMTRFFTPDRRSNMTARDPPSTLYSEACSRETPAPRPTAPCAILERMLVAIRRGPARESTHTHTHHSRHRTLTPQRSRQRTASRVRHYLALSQEKIGGETKPPRQYRIGANTPDRKVGPQCGHGQ